MVSLDDRLVIIKVMCIVWESSMFVRNLPNPFSRCWILCPMLILDYKWKCTRMFYLWNILLHSLYVCECTVVAKHQWNWKISSPQLISNKCHNKWLKKKWPKVRAIVKHLLWEGEGGSTGKLCEDSIRQMNGGWLRKIWLFVDRTVKVNTLMLYLFDVLSFYLTWKSIWQLSDEVCLSQMETIDYSFTTNLYSAISPILSSAGVHIKTQHISDTILDAGYGKCWEVTQDFKHDSSFRASAIQIRVRT